MAIINQSNILNLQPGITASVVVHMSEGDVGTKLSFKLIDGARAWTDPGNVVAAVHGRRQDGTQFGPYACTISGDVVSFQTDAAMAGAAGSGIAQIVLTDNNGNTAGTANFAIMVERATFVSGVTYSNDVSVYEAILAYVQNIPAAVTEDYKAKIAEEANERKAADLALIADTEALQSELTAEIRERVQQDTVLSARMDEFTKLPDGSLSTAADAELVDIRVMDDGQAAATAGDAVREQYARLKAFLNESEKIYITNWAQGGISASTGSNLTATNRCRTPDYRRFPNIEGNLINVNVKSGYAVSISAYTSAAVSGYDRNLGYATFSGSKDVKMFPAYYYRFVIRKEDESDFTPEEVPSDVLLLTLYSVVDKNADEAINAITDAFYNYTYEPDFPMFVGGLSAQGAVNNLTNRARTSYISITPGASYCLTLSGSDYSFFNPCTYESNRETTFIRRITSDYPVQTLYFTAESDEHYLRLAFIYQPDINGHVFTEEELDTVKAALSIRIASGNEVYKNKTGDFEFFTVTVDRPLSYGGAEVIDATKQEEVECVLRLPDSYSTTGTPTRLVLACHGGTGYIDAANTWWYSNANGWKPFMDSLLAAGYAVFDSNVFPTSEGTEIMGRGLGSPAYINVLKKAYDYIQSNYNVYPEIFAHGTSMGGNGASDFTKAYPEIVLAESSFAGRDMSQYVHAVDTGYYDDDDDFARVWGYSTMADLKADKWSHIEGCAPALSLLKIVNGVLQYPPDRESDFENWLAYYGSIQTFSKNDPIGDYTGIRPTVPYKAWESWSDDEQNTKAKFILQKAFRANGFIYEVVAYDNYSHDQMCYGKVEDMRNQLIAWYKRWE